MLIETDYKGYRLEISAELDGERWNATVRMRRLLTEEKPPARDRHVPDGDVGARGDGGRDMGPGWVDLNGC